MRGPLQYVDAEEDSGEHNVTVVDLPRIERVKLITNIGLDQPVENRRAFA